MLARRSPRTPPVVDVTYTIAQWLADSYRHEHAIDGWHHYQHAYTQVRRWAPRDKRIPQLPAGIVAPALRAMIHILGHIPRPLPR